MKKEIAKILLDNLGTDNEREVSRIAEALRIGWNVPGWCKTRKKYSNRYMKSMNLDNTYPALYKFLTNYLVKS